MTNKALSSTLIAVSTAILAAFLPILSVTVDAVRFPSFGAVVQPLQKHLQQRQLRKRYTPLVFFKVPPGLIPECDAMEQVVTQVEQELGICVQRLDILRDPAAEAALAVLTLNKRPPFLYHRESCQTVHVLSGAEAAAAAAGGGKRKEALPSNKQASSIMIDKDRVRAWAKGRYLPPPSTAGVVKGGNAAAPPRIIQGEDKGMDQEELLMDNADDERLTPLQRKGKQAIQERTERAAAK